MTTFKPGVSGNPSGRPKGSLNKSTQIIKIMPELLQSLAGQEIEISDFKSLMEVFIAHDNEVDHSNRQREKLKIDATDLNEAAKAYA